MQQRLVDTIGLQYRKGIAAKLQLRQSEGVLAQVQGTVPVLQGRARQRAQRSGRVDGRTARHLSRALSASGMIPAAPAITDIGSPAGLLQRRPDLIAARRFERADRIGDLRILPEALAKRVDRHRSDGFGQPPYRRGDAGAGHIRAALAAVRFRPQRCRDQDRARPQRRSPRRLPAVGAARVLGCRGCLLRVDQPRAAAAYAGGRRQGTHARTTILDGSL